ncbi:MAG TPA: ATP-binding protein, partial [Myxococcaceae bacterium]|nr:ATP-binding protein [Myxococcaceae bacterium]
MTHALLTVEIRQEQDVVLARQRARQIAALLGFGEQDQTRVATALSEIARNAFKYAGRGTVEFEYQPTPPALLLRVRDPGPGIPDVQRILDGRFTSATGMGLGITGSRRLMDTFELTSHPGQGTVVHMAKYLPPATLALGPSELAKVGEELARRGPQQPLEVVEQQNRELLHALAEVEKRETELNRLNSELQETNSGVVALSNELEDKAEALRRASEMKSRFLSNVSHEFRTPLNSILSLSRLLLERVDGPLTEEQEKQVTFINKSAAALSELINDLLDLAKIEAGKTEVRPTELEVAELFSTLRGMLRPLLTSDAVALVFEPTDGLPRLFTDEGKLAQILRNFISNALKFTERGEVRVRAQRGPGGTVLISVADTGIGIPPEHHQRIFEEFAQVEGPLQRKVKGTGLGLPLSRKLAQLLGGDITLHSAVGHGSTFTLQVPAVYRQAQEVPARLDQAWRDDPSEGPVLVVEDDADTLDLYREHLAAAGFDLVMARSLGEARAVLERVRPSAVVLDVLLGAEVGWDLLS